MQKLIEQIAAAFGLTADDLRGNSRRQYISEARQACMWALKMAYPALSLEAIGELLGRRDHTTVIYGLQRVEERMRADATLATQLRSFVTEPPALTRRPRLSQAMRWWASQSRDEWIVMAA